MTTEQPERWRPSPGAPLRVSFDRADVIVEREPDGRWCARLLTLDGEWPAARTLVVTGAHSEERAARDFVRWAHARKRAREPQPETWETYFARVAESQRRRVVMYARLPWTWDGDPAPPIHPERAGGGRG